MAHDIWWSNIRAAEPVSIYCLGYIMAIARFAETRWTSWVVEPLNQDGEFSKSPVVELLELHRGDSQSAIQKMQRLEDMGFTEARQKLKVKDGKRAIVRPDKVDPAIWELKTTPHPWRLYFHQVEQEKYIIYTHAVYKQKQQQDPNDVVIARRLLLRLAGRTARRKEFVFDR